MISRTILPFLKMLSLIFIIFSIIYLLLRISTGFIVYNYGYLIYFHNLQLNLKEITYYLDLFIIFINIIATSIYFKNKILPILLMIFIVAYLPLHFIFKLGIEDVTEVKSEYLNDTYLVELLHTPVSREKISLSIFVYKKEFPFMYKNVGRKIEVFSKVTDEETINLYKDNAYEVSEDGKFLTYGKFVIPLE